MPTIEKKYRIYYIALGLAWLAYCALTFLAPISTGAERYHLSSLSLHLVQLTIVIPVLLIWFLALHGGLRFKHYADSIKQSKDGAALNLVAQGLLWLVAYLVLPSVIRAASPFFYNSPNLGWSIILSNYLSVLTAIASLVLLYLGSMHLNRLVGASTWSAKRIIGVLLPYCIFAGLFTWLFFTNPNLQTASSPDVIPTHFLSETVALLTIVLPYLLIWLLGLMAAANINHYALTIEGKIYRRALKNLVAGILAVIFFTIVLQLLTAASSTLAHLGIEAILALVYVILVLDGLGFIYIASGAKKLAKIEAVQ